MVTHCLKKKWLAEREGFTDNQGLLSVLTIISRSYEKVEVKINDKSRIPLAPGFLFKHKPESSTHNDAVFRFYKHKEC